MSRRRERRKEEKATFGRKGTATRYQMRQKLVAFGDDFYITTAKYPNTLERYKIIDRKEGIKFNDDGSLTMTNRHCEPEDKPN